MKRGPNGIILLLLLFMALGLVLGGFLLYQQASNPLTRVEKQLVGSWLIAEGQEEEPGAGITLNSDRTFQSSDGQFFGHWRITSGELHIEYKGERNWLGNSWIEKMLSGLKSQTTNRNQFDLTYDSGKEGIKLTELSDGTVSTLIRAEEWR